MEKEIKAKQEAELTSQEIKVAGKTMLDVLREKTMSSFINFEGIKE
jgi:hypothetical protein